MPQTINTDHLQKYAVILEKSALLVSASEKGSIDYDVYRLAVIKGFELTLETSGKLLRKALKLYISNPRDVDNFVFKDLFRHAHKYGLIDTPAVERWMNYRDNRNSTAHDYGEGFAEQTLAIMTDFVADVKKLADTLGNI